jgi:hypothetical protein
MRRAGRLQCGHGSGLPGEHDDQHQVARTESFCGRAGCDRALFSHIVERHTDRQCHDDGRHGLLRRDGVGGHLYAYPNYGWSENADRNLRWRWQFRGELQYDVPPGQQGSDDDDDHDA